ncbi:SAM-dependent methyltransferase [Nonomuraea sp. NPDC046802]|uniref:SAM-dependent methyltransferase n=1 Tax=Nonomuraea sp. NPDC046802 TaxID=3154919 RepID=UPI0033F52F8F
MTDDLVNGLLIRANRALDECEFLLRLCEDEILDLPAEARRHCDEAERRKGDAESAATIAVLRSTAAIFALRHCVYFEVGCDFDDDDGTLLDGLGDHDEAGVSRSRTDQAIEAARAALFADPDDPLVPMQLGHALTWSGDRDGAVAAFEEAVRRAPRDLCTRSCLEYLGAAPADPPPDDGMSHGRYEFVLLRELVQIDNNNVDHRFLIFGSVADARAHAEEAEEPDGDLLLRIHRPGRPVVEYAPMSQDDWPSDIELRSPLPPAPDRRQNLFPRWRPPVSENAVPAIDTSKPHSARVWDFFLGGKDHYPVDRAMGEEYQKIFPGIIDIARTDRAFLGRAVRHLVEQAGIRQFLDIGTGLPTMDNTHEVAQRIAPDSRVVYVDNDPLVLVHARALLVGAPEGATDYAEADLRDPEEILRRAAKTLDFSQPVAIMLLGILHFIPDYDQVRQVVRRLLDAVPSGSYLALTHATFDLGDTATVEANAEAQEAWNDKAADTISARTSDQILRFFDGLELVEPGLVSMSRWRVEATPFGEPDDVAGYCGVGRKP